MDPRSGTSRQGAHNTLSHYYGIAVPSERGDTLMKVLRHNAAVFMRRPERLQLAFKMMDIPRYVRQRERERERERGEGMACKTQARVFRDGISLCARLQ